MRSSNIARPVLALLLAMQPRFLSPRPRAARKPIRKTNRNMLSPCPATATNFRATISIIPTIRPSGGITRATSLPPTVVDFGFELTFFRQGVNRDATKTNSWDVRDLYLAHLALSDLDGGHFYHTERTNRAGPGIAGVSAKDARIWNGNWQIQWNGDQQTLQAIDPRFDLRFTLKSEKPPVIQGENGISQKAAGAGHASHYISLTRLATNGTITLGGKSIEVTGLAWMDHEFFTHQLERDQIGWDWFSVQLDDNTELMLFRIRRKTAWSIHSPRRRLWMAADKLHIYAQRISL